MSDYITGIRLENWRCFRGEHVLEDLRPISYAITARETSNPDRSNWLGKSSLCEAVRYCLTGELRKEESTSSWVTRGEKSGGVDVELSSGAFMSRRRDGSKGSLYVEVGDLQLTGPDAQRWINQNIIEADLVNLTIFFEQGKTDQLITMTPAKRTETVVDWLGLEKVQEAEAICVRRYREMKAEYDRNIAVIDPEYDIPTLERTLASSRSEVELSRQDVTAAREALNAARVSQKTWDNWKSAQEALSSRRAVQAGMRGQPVFDDTALLAAETQVEETLKVLATAEATTRTTKESVRAAKRLASGQFDGACPASPGFECPARSAINARRQENSNRLEEARQECSKATNQEEAVQGQLATGRRALSKLKHQKRDHGSHLLALKETEWALDYEGLSEPTRPDLNALTDALTSATRDLATDEASVTGIENTIAKVKRAQARIADLSADIDIERAATVVLGRSGAQRELAEGALADIASRANSAMSNAGVPLSLEVSWGAEGKKLETDCTACGYHYGSSQKDKECPKCDTTRSLKFDAKLRIELKNVSGGSRNIAGLMLQLAAAHWLRASRGIGLASYFIDEPFGQMDRSNRLGIAAKLHSMMESEFGARQAFVVAHDNDTLETLPARIQITSTDGNSRVEVLHGG